MCRSNEAKYHQWKYLVPSTEQGKTNAIKKASIICCYLFFRFWILCWNSGLFFKQEILQCFGGTRRWKCTVHSEHFITFQWCLVKTEAKQGFSLQSGVHETTSAKCIIIFVSGTTMTIPRDPGLVKWPGILWLLCNNAGPLNCIMIWTRWLPIPVEIKHILQLAVDIVT